MAFKRLSSTLRTFGKACCPECETGKACSGEPRPPASPGIVASMFGKPGPETQAKGFCPTGDGGGVDNSCGDEGGGGGGGKKPSGNGVKKPASDPFGEKKTPQRTQQLMRDVRAGKLSKDEATQVLAKETADAEPKKEEPKKEPSSPLREFGHIGAKIGDIATGARDKREAEAHRKETEDAAKDKEKRESAAEKELEAAAKEHDAARAKRKEKKKR